jgi:hypothetical protein
MRMQTINKKKQEMRDVYGTDDPDELKEDIDSDPDKAQDRINALN